MSELWTDLWVLLAMAATVLWQVECYYRRFYQKQCNELSDMVERSQARERETLARERVLLEKIDECFADKRVGEGESKVVN